MPHYCHINSAFWVERSGLGWWVGLSCFPVSTTIALPPLLPPSPQLQPRATYKDFQQSRNSLFGGLSDFFHSTLSLHQLLSRAQKVYPGGSLNFKELLLKGSSWDPKANSNLGGETCHFFLLHLCLISHHCQYVCMAHNNSGIGNW